MELENFILELKDQFVAEIPNLSAATEFKKLESWDSMTALLIISFIDENYKVPINGDDLRSVHTIGELYDLVLKKKS